MIGFEKLRSLLSHFITINNLARFPLAIGIGECVQDSRVKNTPETATVVPIHSFSQSLDLSIP